MHCVSKFFSSHLLNRVGRRSAVEAAPASNGQHPAERFLALEAAFEYIPSLGRFDLRAEVLRAADGAAWAAGLSEPAIHRRSLEHQVANGSEPEVQTFCEPAAASPRSAEGSSSWNRQVQRRPAVPLETIQEEEEPFDEHYDFQKKTRSSEYQAQAGNHWHRAPTGRFVRNPESERHYLPTASCAEAWWTVENFAPLAVKGCSGIKIRKHNFNEVFPGKQQPMKKIRFDTTLVLDVIPEVVKKVHFDAVPVEIPDVKIVHFDSELTEWPLYEYESDEDEIEVQKEECECKSCLNLPLCEGEIDLDEAEPSHRWWSHPVPSTNV